MASLISAEELRASFKSKRKGWSEDLRVRIHRAISWLDSAEKHSEDNDIALLSLLIAIHACYLRDDEGHKYEGYKPSDTWEDFVNNMRGTKQLRGIYSQFRTAEGVSFVKDVMLNIYLLSHTWRYDVDYGKEFMERHQSHLLRFVQQNKTDKLLGAALLSLNMLRNQIAHGSRTYDSQLNAEAVAGGKNFLFRIVPLFILAMIENPEKNWGAVAFPVIR